jgi:poly(A) polymerase
MRISKLKRFMARPNFEDELELHRVDCEGSNGMLENHEYLKRKREEFAREPLIPPRLVTGHDLIELGYSAGPSLGKILTQVQNAQLEGEIRSREEAIAWLEAHHSDDAQDVD